MAQKTQVQNAFIANAIEKKTRMELFTINGYRLKGIIREVDDYTLLVDDHGKQQLVYKSAISTITQETASK